MRKPFIESRSFTGRVHAFLDEEPYAALQVLLVMADPNRGSVMRGCGGRRLRVANVRRQEGKRSGARVIYPHIPEVNWNFMLDIYSKEEKGDLDTSEKKVLRQLAERLKQESLVAAAEAMRRILLDRARDKRRLKRGGGWRRLRLDQIDLALDGPPDDLFALDEALGKLAAEDPVGAELVKLRFFAGLPQDEAAHTLGIARRTADRYAAGPEVARRHRAVVRSVVVSLIVVLVLAVVGLAVGMVAVNRERRETDRAYAAEARRRQQIRGVLDRMTSAARVG